MIFPITDPAEVVLFLTFLMKLRSGIEMPLYGLGTWTSSNEVARAATSAALSMGVRLIDTAAMYENESGIGEALAASDLKREDYFVVTKLKPADHLRAEEALVSSLSKLGLTYVDVYLMHSPTGKHVVETWRALLRLKSAGLAQAVGVSNFGCAQLEELRLTGLEMPEVNQIEVNVFNPQSDAISFCRQHGIVVMGFCPLARCQQFGKPEIKDLAARLGRTEADVMLRWSLQSGVVTIPKSARPE